MAFRARFVAGLALRLLLLVVATLGVFESFRRPGFGAARILAFGLAGWAMLELWRYIQRTNRELARFLEALRLGDLSQSFSHRAAGSGFSEIGEALDLGIRRLREERHRLTDASRFYEAVLDDAPTPLLTVDDEGRVELANKAARRLFVRHTGVRVDDFIEYGDAFSRALTDQAIGQPKLVPLMLDGVPQSAMLTAAAVHRLGGFVRVVAVQPIQGELNAVEIAAQSDLVRVLTHEIMNSMTPVTSLAHSAASLMAEADRGGDPVIADARYAVDTLARRADGVMGFVESYRQISRTPEVRRRLFEAQPWARELESLFRASNASEGVDFTLSVVPEAMNLDLDPDLMCQVLLNLLKNSAEAVRDRAEAPAIWLAFKGLARGRVRIEVADNGPGVPETLRQDIFLPFFTTKAKGSGVGLSLARQVVLAHGGSIAISDRDGGGALFTIVL
jgi:nitrogen fixation/metabolism regulation signal transduction histidine kinase